MTSPHEHSTDEPSAGELNTETPAQPTGAADRNGAGRYGVGEIAAELDWQAWLYVAGELDDAARDAFEARLLDEVAACEAVARAVELTDLMAAARPALVQDAARPALVQDAARPALVQDAARPAFVQATAIPSQSIASWGAGVAGESEMIPLPRPLAGGNWSQRVGWMALGAAACLGVMLTARAWQAGEFGGAVADDSDQQVVAGADDARTLADVWTELWNMDDALSPAESYDAALDRADAVLAGASRNEDDSAPPDWLLAAVADDAAKGDLPAPPQAN